MLGLQQEGQSAFNAYKRARKELFTLAGGTFGQSGVALSESTTSKREQLFACAFVGVERRLALALVIGSAAHASCKSGCYRCGMQSRAPSSRCVLFGSRAV